MIHLFVPFYVDARVERRQEIEASVRANIKNGCLASVTLFCEQRDKDRALALIPNGRGGVEVLARRQHYQDLIQKAGQYVSDVIVIANVDIVFDQTIAFAEQIVPMQVLCLTRSERRPFNEGLYWPEAETGFCQDVWIFRPPLRIPGNYEFGRLGCENRFAGECKAAGYSLFNPCRKIHAIHNHASGIRNYKVNGPQEVGPPHAHVFVTPDWPPVIRVETEPVAAKVLPPPPPAPPPPPPPPPPPSTDKRIFIVDCVMAQLGGLWANRSAEALMSGCDEKIRAMFDIAEKAEREARRRGLI